MRRILGLGKAVFDVSPLLRLPRRRQRRQRPNIASPRKWVTATAAWETSSSLRT